MGVTLALAIALGAGAWFPASAAAATVSQSARVEHGTCEASRTCPTLVTTRFDAASDEVNRVEVVADRGAVTTGPAGSTGSTGSAGSAGSPTLRFVDRGTAPLRAGAGCEGRPDGSVVCPLVMGRADQRSTLRVWLGDRDDTLRLVDAAGHGLRSLPGGAAFDGGTGDDRIDASGTLRGGPGRDRLLGGAGGDTLEGGAGADHLDGGSGEDILLGGTGNDVLRGGPSSDDLIGGPGNDRLAAGPGFDDLRGGTGHDRLDGGTSPDHLFGGAGHDRLDGGPDHRLDDLHGGPGFDRARRRAGDTFAGIEWLS